MQATIPSRSEIAPEHTWNAESLFASAAAWEGELGAIAAALPDLEKQKGRLADGPVALVEALTLAEELMNRTYKVLFYAAMSYSVDTTDQGAAAMNGRARGLMAQTFAAAAFIEPELLAIGRETLTAWMGQESRLAMYEHYVDNLFRRRAHVRTAEVEQVLGMAMGPFAGVSTTANALTNADFQFQPAVASDGASLPLTQGTMNGLRASADREVRRTAWQNYLDQYLAYKNTLASNLITSVTQDVFMMRVRGYSSTLAASLFEDNIPVAVFHNLVETFRRNLPTWHRYWRVRQKALGVETLHPYDIWAPLRGEPASIPFEQAVAWICDGLAPMGEEYTSAIRRGTLRDRWVDRYPNLGKRDGAFSGGTRGTHPFIMMSYDGTVFSLSTLAHELGHSMHSYLAWKHQPFVYSRYSLFAAEVASNFHQAMTRAHLLKTQSDASFQITVIEEAMSNFHRYFLIMPTLARFELEIHEQVERGQNPTAATMIELCADLFAEAYGPDMHIDRQRLGILWATFGHLYRDYYVFQYATGISAAHTLANGILAGKPGAVDAYLSFLKAGGSLYPLDALKLAGVDMASPQAVEETFAVMAGLVDRLESLL